MRDACKTFALMLGIFPTSYGSIIITFMHTCKGCSDCIDCLSAAKSQRAGGAKPMEFQDFRIPIDVITNYNKKNLDSWAATIKGDC